MRLIPGTVVDTPEGPRLLPPGKALIIFFVLFSRKNNYYHILKFIYLSPPDIKGDGIDLDYVVQGFDIDQIEARYLQKKRKSLY